MMTPRDRDIRRYLENWQSEVDGAAQYRAMAAGERERPVADLYLRLAAVEEKHAAFWERELQAAGRDPGPRRPSWRARTLSWVARRFGASLVLPAVARGEYASRNQYVDQTETRGTAMTGEERMHARVLGKLLGGSAAGVRGPALASLEGRHRNVGGNALRAGVLGANDGLCSNLSLVMGVAGASGDARLITLSGLAGLLAGSFSMALGEWVSVTSARELAAREMRIERAELEQSPDEEREELRLIYEAKGLDQAEANQLSQKLMADPKTALDALSREELGIDPVELGGSALVAAATSFLLFALGAVVPVLPFLFSSGSVAIGTSLLASGLGLFVIGAAITLFTGRSVWLSGGRQLLLGFAAAAATFGIGKAIGVAVS
jgi:VIT1/CCC1 family predicted Fe2+/Mn2+ transporter